MSRSRPRAKVPTAEPRRGRSSRPGATDDAFALRWNDVDADHRRQVRRLVRMGRPQESAADAELASGFAAHQRRRAWYRAFWLWLPVLTVAGLVAGLNTHPIVIGMVLAAAGNAVLVRWNFARAEKVNAALLDGGAAPVAA